MADRHRHASLNPDNMTPEEKTEAQLSSPVAPPLESMLGTPIDFHEFSQPSKDHNGHSSAERVNILPGYAIEMQNIIESRRFPYRGVHDLLRHAIARHVKWLRMLDTAPPTVLGQVIAMARVLQEEEWLGDFEDVFTRTHSMVRRHIEAGQPGQARALVDQLRTHIVEMPEGGWKTRYQEQFAREFGE